MGQSSSSTFQNSSQPLFPRRHTKSLHHSPLSALPKTPEPTTPEPPKTPSYADPKNKVLPNGAPQDMSNARKLLRPVSQELSKFHPEFADIFQYDPNSQFQAVGTNFNAGALDKENASASAGGRLTNGLRVSKQPDRTSFGQAVPNPGPPAELQPRAESFSNPRRSQSLTRERAQPIGIPKHKRQTSVTSGVSLKDSPILEDPREHLYNVARNEPFSNYQPSNASLPLKSTFDMDYSMNLTYAQLAEYRRQKRASEMDMTTGQKLEELGAEITASSIVPKSPFDLQNLSGKSRTHSISTRSSDTGVSKSKKKKAPAPPPPPLGPAGQNSPLSGAQPLPDYNMEQSLQRSISSVSGSSKPPAPQPLAKRNSAASLQIPFSATPSSSIAPTSTHSRSMSSANSGSSTDTSALPFPGLNSIQKSISDAKSHLELLKKRQGSLKEFRISENIPQTNGPLMKKYTEAQKNAAKVSDIQAKHDNNGNAVTNKTSTYSKGKIGVPLKVPPPSYDTTLADLDSRLLTETKSSASSSSPEPSTSKKMNSLLQNDIVLAAQARGANILKAKPPLVFEKPRDPSEIFREQLAREAKEREERMRETTVSSSKGDNQEMPPEDNETRNIVFQSSFLKVSRKPPQKDTRDEQIGVVSVNATENGWSAGSAKMENTEEKATAVSFNKHKTDYKDTVVGASKDKIDIEGTAANVNKDKTDYEGTAVDVNKYKTDYEGTVAYVNKDKTDYEGTGVDVNKYKTDYEGTAANVNKDKTDYEGTAVDVNKYKTDYEGTVAYVNKYKTDYEGTAVDVNKYKTDYEGTAVDVNKDKTDYEGTAVDVNKYKTDYEGTAAYVNKDKTDYKGATVSVGKVNPGDTSTSVSAKTENMEVRDNVAAVTTEKHEVKNTFKEDLDQGHKSIASSSISSIDFPKRPSIQSEDMSISSSNTSQRVFPSDWTPEHDLASDDDIMDEGLAVTKRTISSEGFKSSIIPSKLTDLKNSRKKKKIYKDDNPEVSDQPNAKLGSIRQFKKTVHKSVRSAFDSLSKASGKLTRRQKSHEVLDVRDPIPQSPPPDTDEDPSEGLTNRNWVLTDKSGRGALYRTVSDGYIDHSEAGITETELSESSGDEIGDIDFASGIDDEPKHVKRHNRSISENENLKLMKRAGVAYVAKKGQIIVLPEYETVKRDDGSQIIHDSRDKDDGHAPKLFKSKSKKYAYESTVRGHEKNKMQEAMAREIYEKEKQIALERQKQKEMEKDFQRLRELGNHKKIQRLRTEKMREELTLLQEQPVQYTHDEVNNNAPGMPSLNVNVLHNGSSSGYLPATNSPYTGNSYLPTSYLHYNSKRHLPTSQYVMNGGAAGTLSGAAHYNNTTAASLVSQQRYSMPSFTATTLEQPISHSVLAATGDPITYTTPVAGGPIITGGFNNPAVPNLAPAELAFLGDYMRSMGVIPPATQQQWALLLSTITFNKPGYPSYPTNGFSNLGHGPDLSALFGVGKTLENTTSKRQFINIIGSQPALQNSDMSPLQKIANGQDLYYKSMQSLDSSDQYNRTVPYQEAFYPSTDSSVPRAHTLPPSHHLPQPTTVQSHNNNGVVRIKVPDFQNLTRDETMDYQTSAHVSRPVANGQILLSQAPNVAGENPVLPAKVYGPIGFRSLSLNAGSS